MTFVKLMNKWENNGGFFKKNNQAALFDIFLLHVEISTAACCDQEEEKKRPLWDKSESKQFQARQPNNELEEDIKLWEEWAKLAVGSQNLQGGDATLHTVVWSIIVFIKIFFYLVYESLHNHTSWLRDRRLSAQHCFLSCRYILGVAWRIL